MALTERQQEIQDLLDQDLTPADIGKRLHITTNAVYQQLRRMHGGKGGGGKGSRRTRARRTAPSAPASTPTAAPARDMTPLQAIRARKSAIEAELREAEKAHAVAVKAEAKAAADLNALADKRSAELGQLSAAEGALTSKASAKPKRERVRARRRASKPAVNGTAARTPDKAAA